MNDEITEIRFAPGDDNRALLIGDGAPFRFARSEIRTLPGGIMTIILKQDAVTERYAAESATYKRMVENLFGIKKSFVRGLIDRFLFEAGIIP